jgi:hypothetical protein
MKQCTYIFPGKIFKKAVLFSAFYFFCLNNFLLAQKISTYANCAGTTVATPSGLCTGSTTALSLSGDDFWANTYQWQLNLNGGGWNNIVGAISSTYTTPALTNPNSYQYRCNVSGSSALCTTSFSSVVTITPDATPTTANAGPDQAVCATTATLAGNSPTTGTGTWTLVSGTGTITTPSSATSGLTGLGVGANTFRWTIANGVCTSSTDDVIITNNNPSTANAGADQAVCTTTATMAASAPTSGTGAWSLVSGSGTITTPSSNTSGLTALGSGANTFRWTVTASCGTSTDDVVITNNIPTTSNAGTDQNLCGGTTGTLAGNAPGGGETGLWTKTGTITFTTATSATSAFTAESGTANCTWTITKGACTSADVVVITQGSAPTASSAGADQEVCATTATLAGNTSAGHTGVWTNTAGSGTITTPTSATSGLTALGIGVNTFRWTLTKTVCTSNASTTNDVNITRDDVPTTSAAGTDQEVCATTATLAGNTPTVGSGTWTKISGTGTITTPSSATSGLTALGVGANTFRWTITNGVCASSTDDVIITRDATPSASAAGADQEVCATTATLAGNNPATGTGTWTLVSGSGTITNPALRTSGLTALGIGANTFRWTIANGVCASSTDDVIITNNNAAGGTASATTGCGSSSTLSLTGYNGTIQWQQRVNAGAWGDIAGATTTPYTVTGLTAANAYDFRANLTTSCGTATSSTASLASVAAASYTFGSPSITLSTYNGSCVATYTFTQSTTANRESAINTGVTATINFMAGTNATTMTSGTFNGTAINMGTVVKTATSVTFTTPTNVCASTSFKIVLVGITNPAYGSGTGNGTVSIPNFSTGTDSYTTYSYTIANSIASFFDYGGGLPSYATANTSGDCINNLTAGQTYCFNYKYPSSGDIEMDLIKDPGTAGGGCSSGTSYASASPANGGGCASNAGGNYNTYSAECNFIYSGSEVGSGCPLTAGTLYTVCFTVPAGCTGMNLCPLVHCTAGNCGATPLPVQLLFFSAIALDKEVELQWATATEMNNNYFTIERSQNAADFEPMATVSGSGYSSSTLYYHAYDEKPLPDKSYYRLKQTDYNGMSAYLGIVSVQNFSDVAIYPTVTSGMVLITGLEKSNSEITVYSMMGEKVFSLSNNHEPAVDLGALPNGIYVIGVQTEKKVYTQKLVIQK